MVEPSFDANALRVLERRYLRRNSEGKVIETPDELLWRVANTVADVERDIDPGADIEAVAASFHDEMARLRFLPNSPALGAGRVGAQLAACFVLPIEDDLASIFESLKQAALIHQSGGGTGFDFSELRPSGDQVATSGGIASGPISFLRLYDSATEVIKQGGVRRGANMGVLRVDHPDILAFIGEKADPGRLQNFNVSVAVNEAFMAAVESGDHYDLINPRDHRPVRRLLASKVWNAVVRHAWYSGEPGVLFIDRIEEENPVPKLGSVTATNPCGEQPLLPYESCTLGSINVSSFSRGTEGVAWQELGQTVRLAIRFLDDLIEAGSYPIEPIRRMTTLTRKVGLGVMGFADMLIDLGIPYDSAKALTMARRLMSFMREQARTESAALAERRGPFPAWEDSRLKQQGLLPQRNATVTTIAPTGTLSLLASCSPGIEPLYAVRFDRRVFEEELFEQVPRALLEQVRAHGLDPLEVLERAGETGSLRRLTDLPEDLRRRFVTAIDLSFDWHVRMQAAFQEHTDNAVSKTVNLPEEATTADVQAAYWLAYELGCKGLTVYREGSRARQIMERRRAGMDEPPKSAKGEMRACPDCEEPIPSGGRCLLCRACGWSACISPAGLEES